MFVSEVMPSSCCETPKHIERVGESSGLNVEGAHSEDISSIIFPFPFDILIRRPTNVAEGVIWQDSGELGREIQMPSTSIPLCNARMPKGISGVRMLAIPQYDMRVSLARFSSSMISWRRIERLDHHSLISPAMKTRTIQQPRTLGYIVS